MPIDYHRQLDWFDPDKNPLSSVIVGCGGIGSFTAVALAMLGIKSMVLVDDDVVEWHNKPNQLFRIQDVGKPKAQALAEIVDQLTGCEVGYILGKYPFEDGTTKLNYDVVVSAVDSMSARKIIWEFGSKYNCGTKLFVDGRIGGQQLRILSVKNCCDKTEIDRYEQTISSDEKAAQLVCTAQSIIDIGFLISSQIVRLVRNHFTGKLIPHELVCDVEHKFELIEYN